MEVERLRTGERPAGRHPLVAVQNTGNDAPNPDLLNDRARQVDSYRPGRSRHSAIAKLKGVFYCSDGGEFIGHFPGQRKDIVGGAPAIVLRVGKDPQCELQK